MNNDTRPRKGGGQNRHGGQQGQSQQGRNGAQQGCGEHGGRAGQQGCGERGNHGGHGGCGKKQPMQRFMETSLLVLLAEQSGHGYSLTEQLKHFGFSDINVSTLYRIMRKMDERGWVSSSWEKGDKGPQRRVYSITDNGRAALDEWIDVFVSRKSNIETLLGKYDELKK